MATPTMASRRGPDNQTPSPEMSLMDIAMQRNGRAKLLESYHARQADAAASPASSSGTPRTVASGGIDTERRPRVTPAAAAASSFRVLSPAPAVEESSEDIAAQARAALVMATGFLDEPTSGLRRQRPMAAQRKRYRERQRSRWSSSSDEEEVVDDTAVEKAPSVASSVAEEVETNVAPSGSPTDVRVPRVVDCAACEMLAVGLTSSPLDLCVNRGMRSVEVGCCTCFRTQPTTSRRCCTCNPTWRKP